MIGREGGRGHNQFIAAVLLRNLGTMQLFSADFQNVLGTSFGVNQGIDTAAVTH